MHHHNLHVLHKKIAYSSKTIAQVLAEISSDKVDLKVVNFKFFLVNELGKIKKSIHEPLIGSL
jgi:hypothetical protein